MNKCKWVVAPAVLLLIVAGCRSPIKDNPVDEMTNWTRAEIAFATAVESVTLAGRSGEITRAAGARIRPFVQEGNALLQEAYDNIANTPMDQDPVFDSRLTYRLTRIAIQITAHLAVEKKALSELKENQ